MIKKSHQTNFFGTAEAIFDGPNMRYYLTRRWGYGRSCAFCMLNPSTADAQRNDPTVTRCMRFANSWGYKGLVVVNLFAWRATDPHAMLAAHTSGQNIIGEENDGYIVQAADECEKLICAWGNHGDYLGRGAAVLDLLRPMRPYCLTMTQAGHPGHPLYLNRHLQPRLIKYSELK